MVVILGVMQFEQRAFGAPFLKGVKRIQTPRTFFQTLALVISRIGAWLGVPCVNVRTAWQDASLSGEPSAVLMQAL